MIRILGLDPGFANFGWAEVIYDPQAEVTTRVEAMGTFETKKSDKKRKVRDADDNFRRTQEISRFLDDKFAAAQAIAAEEMSSPRNSATVKKMGMAWGVVATLADLYEHPVVHIPPQTLKKEIAHNVKATKGDITEHINQIFEQDLAELFMADLAAGKHEHAYDAVAAALCSLKTDVMRMATKLKET